MLKEENKQLIKKAKLAEAKAFVYNQRIQAFQRGLQNYMQGQPPNLSALGNVTVGIDFTKNDFQRIHAKTVGLLNMKDFGKSTQRTDKKKSISFNQSFNGSFMVSKSTHQKLGKLSTQHLQQTEDFESEKKKALQ